MTYRLATALGAMFLSSFGPARAQSALDLGLTYKADVLGTVAGDRADRIHYLDNIDVTADVDLETVADWRGGTFHLHILNNLGGQPNERAGTLQGVNNIEVEGHGLRVFEAWIEQAFGKGTRVRAGLYDLNSEFYRNDAAGLLIAPAFGVGSEIAATGPNGPSIFPSTALALRVDQRVGKSGYARVAVLNAHASTVGDVGGVNLGLNDGLLLIGEVGTEARGRIAAGVWRYTKDQQDVRGVDGTGSPLRRVAQGGYVLLEQPLNAEDGPWATSAFARAGLSDGRTTSFKGGWQAGLLVQKVVPGRPDSMISLGANQGYLSRGWRANLSDGGVRSSAAETALELTYADKLGPHLTVQPDLQLVFNPGGDRERDPVIIAGLRLTVEL